MHKIEIFEQFNAENFDEQLYLKCFPDVAAAVARGSFPDGRTHFEMYGRFEIRRHRRPAADKEVFKMRREKSKKIAKIIRKELNVPMSPDFKFNCLDQAAIKKFGVEPSANVSSLSYDETPLGIIDELPDGLILDCGAGFRNTYYDNVVNYEIVDYLSTDVIGVAEQLPFVDNAFDAVMSFAVLEHVKFPFVAAAEICRVLKPGGKLAACVPFLQPLHGFPNHYFNMSHMGLKTLFEDSINIERQFVNEGMGPIWTLTWLLRSWAEGLSGPARKKFLSMKVADLTVSAHNLWKEDFVTELSEAKNFELASATFLIGRKMS